MSKQSKIIGVVVLLLIVASLLALPKSQHTVTFAPGVNRLLPILAPPIPRLKAATPVAAQIVAGAKQEIGKSYDPSYQTIAYPNGDVSSGGACTDVVIRALRHSGFDLQQLIHEDMSANFASYPHNWGLTHPDKNIDHRRVPNQMCFFQHHGLTLTTAVSPETLKDWQPGDIVDWDMGGGLVHTGIISDGISPQGLPLVINNAGLCLEEDCLLRWKIIGHYRYDGTVTKIIQRVTLKIDLHQASAPDIAR